MAIKPKTLEPKLTRNMWNIIQRSHGANPDTMTNIDDSLFLEVETFDTESNQETKTNSAKLQIGYEYDEIESYKYKIMDMLTKDVDLISTLHNKELQEVNAKGDDYKLVNIINFLKLPGVQSTVKNYVCFEVHDVEQPNHTDGLMKRYLVFKTYSHEDDSKTDYGIARQDLLALIIKNKFDWSSVFGMHLEKISDYGKVLENGFYYREFIYSTVSTNNLVNKIKRNGVY